MAKILIIEDDADIAAIERDYLVLSGYEVTICPDGASGLTAALEQPFDLLLLDLMLPEVDGFTICRRVREVKDIPILMATALGKGVDKIRGLGYGADDYIEKPFSPSVLVTRVKAHLAQYQRLKPSAVETALLTVGRLRGMKCASVLNNVVRWKECISHGVGSYAAGADAAAAGEEHSILAALETFARLEAEKKLEKTGTFSRF